MRLFRTVLLFAAACAAAFGDTVVVPAAQATASGTTPLPFSTNPIRFQEIIGSGQFPGPITIIGLGVRAFPGGGGVNFTYPSWQVTLSTTQAYPNTANGHTLPSVTYSNNLGPDATVVFNGPISGSSHGCQVPGPCPFDMVIPFSTPFSYDPTQGRLLVDVTTSAASGSPTGSLDAVGFVDATSSTVALVSGDPTKTTGTMNLGGAVFGLETGTSTYYFPHLAFGGGWQTTLTYVDYSPQSASCQTTFYADSGAPVPVPFEGATASVRSDALTAGATLHQQPTAAQADAVTSAWAVAVCSSPIKASILYRYYKQGVAQGEAGVNATTMPTTEFVTFAETKTGIAYANPGKTAANITITALNAAGLSLGTKAVPLAPNAHGAASVGPLLGLNSFTGSVQITSTVPIISLSLNAEAFPVFSALPPGDLPAGTALASGH